MDDDELLSDDQLLAAMTNALKAGLCVNCRCRQLQANHPGIRFCAQCTEGAGFHPTRPGLVEQEKDRYE